jgi:hypothetical protein
LTAHQKSRLSDFPKDMTGLSTQQTRGSLNEGAIGSIWFRINQA